jgi:predicted amidohydrolase
MEKMIKLALIQMTCGDDLGENYDKAVDYIRKAAGQGAHIICTQELFKSRYFWKSTKALGSNGRTMTRTQALRCSWSTSG